MVHSALPTLFRFHPHFFAAAVDAAWVTPARILLAHGRATRDAALLEQAERRLDAAWSLADRQELGWLRLRVLILRALVADANRNRDAAHAALAEAVLQAEPEGVIRPFVDEGAPMAGLLADLAAMARHRHRTGSPSRVYLDALLACFGNRDSGTSHCGPIEPLTAREQEVLQMLGAGLSNAEMAAGLFVEPSTIKTHLIHLYSKFGVHSRSQAVARARALRILD